MEAIEPHGEAAADEKESASLWQTIKSDLGQATGRRLLGGLAVLVWIAFQWGWGNDILLPPIVTRSFEAVDDGTTWWSAVGAVGAGTAMGGLFWGVTQAFDGVVVLSGFGLIPGTTARFGAMLRKQGLIKPYRELSLVTRFFVAFLSGASILCLIDVMATGEKGVGPRRRVLVESVVMAVAGVGAVIVITTSAIAVGARVPATESAAEIVVRFARNPLTWMAIYGTFALTSFVASKLQASSTPTTT